MRMHIKDKNILKKIFLLEIDVNEKRQYLVSSEIPLYLTHLCTFSLVVRKTFSTNKKNRCRKSIDFNGAPTFSDYFCKFSLLLACKFQFRHINQRKFAIQ